MMKFKANILIFPVLLLISSLGMAQDYPLSDPDNEGNWILNGDFSDEFDGDTLNRSRWHIQGESCEGVDGCRDGGYFNNFKGRWPAQFSTENAWVQNGKLILDTRWDPEFDFLDDCDKNTNPNAKIYCYGKDLDGSPLPITTAAVNSLKTFTYGYMEIYSKAADAEITSAFWTIGGGGEFDMFEMFGKYEAEGKKHKEKELKFNMIEWSDGFEPRFDTFIKTDWRVADDFHVYGFDWSDTSMKIYIDGVFNKEYTAADFDKGEGTDWFYTGAQRLWVDQECFYWNGLPNEEDLPAKYEIEYIRIWQKESQIEDTTAPDLSNLDTTLGATEGEVSVTVSEQSQLFLVPEGTANDITSIETADKTPTIANEGTANIIAIGKETGTYIIYAIDWAGNISEATIPFAMTEVIPSGIESNGYSLRFSVYPNPSNSFIQITSSEDIQSGSVLLVNVLGQASELILLDNNVIDVSNLESGIYFIHILGYSSTKFIKK